MGGGVERLRGGIFGLLEFLDEHEAAYKIELLSYGYRYGELGDGIPWDVAVAVANNPWPGKALAVSVHGEAALWSPDTYLLAMQVDVLHSANWQRSGGKGPRPKATKRPGDSAGQKLGSEPIPMSEFDDWWESAV